jgi:hypothetical protein
MRQLTAIAGAAAVLGIVAVSSTASHAAAGSDKAKATRPAKHNVARHRYSRHGGAAGPAHKYTREGGHGCYRWGETGYHWYDFCLGPSWLYPHQRVCRQGYCWYR